MRMTAVSVPFWLASCLCQPALPEKASSMYAVSSVGAYRQAASSFIAEGAPSVYGDRGGSKVFSGGLPF